MKMKAEFCLLEIPGSRSTGILEKNSLQCWIEPNREDAVTAIAQWHGMEVEKPQMKKREWGGKDRSICLESTYACNLRCKYCFMADDPEYCANHRDMEISTAIAFLKKYCHPNHTDKVSVIFMGGEPTMNMDLICRVVEWCRKNYKKSSFSLTTNGTLLAKELRTSVSFNLNPKLNNLTIGEWLARNKFGITLSCDGPKVVHDSMRVHGDGSGSFDEMWEALRITALKSTLWLRRFTFRGTYSNDWAVSLKDRLVFFNRAISAGVGGSVHLEPSVLQSADLPLVAQQHHEATEWFISEVQAGNQPKWGDLTKTLRKLVNHQPTVKNCGAGVNYITCGVDGQIYACHRTFGAEIGHIKTGIDTEKAAGWEDNRVYQMPDCASCEIKYVCGGGCRAANHAENGSVTTPSTTNCFVRKLRVACSLRIIEALTKEELARICPSS